MGFDFQDVRQGCKNIDGRLKVKICKCLLASLEKYFL